VVELDALLAGYRPLPGIADELKDATGAVRPVWRDFVAHFLAWSPEKIAARFARGEQYLRDAGVYHRVYEQSGSTERDWPLSHVPVLIDGAEWRRITAGLVQRAELLESIAADLYGENRLVADGLLPAPLVAGNPEWLRPLVGVQPAAGHFLQFVAFEIGRGPSGDWWVLGDRTQAPSGVAFALENRVATSRIYAELFAHANVHRLASFFRSFRDALQALRRETDGPIGILTPGPLNDTYYEHAYIARYLGFALLEGEDLIVEHGRVMVRTVEGPRPLSVLWRRIDSSYVDPLELDERSQLGTPGLVDALRRRTLTMINMPGTGVLETRALHAFLPRLCRALTGSELLLPNIATWWCGQAAEREHVLANLERMMVGPALSTRLPYDEDGSTVAAAPRDLADLRARLAADGGGLVGQEAVQLSTTPAWVDGRLVPRPMVLRVFLGRTAQGWAVMPGGFARIGSTEDAAAIALQRGGTAADVWVIGDVPVAVDSMIAPSGTPYARLPAAPLPSRAAENLYWLGRYSERAEGTMRLMRAWHARLAEGGDADAPLVAWLTAYLDGLGLDVEQPVPDALLQSLHAATNCASRIRDRFAVDGWAAITDLNKSATRLAGKVAAGSDAAHAMGVLLRKVSGFSGLVHENMYRFAGWHFLVLGRSVERAASMASLLAATAEPDVPEGALDVAIEAGDSVMTHRRRFAVATQTRTVLDLLALDPLNPRSVVHNLELIREHAAQLTGAPADGPMTPVVRAAVNVHLALAAQSPETLDAARLRDVEQQVWRLSDLVATTYWP
jgi:uncharacterized circularly permuted ATP-grasp superfamily protein/uncharacterized alpha-E superfamily protein